jgi:hypothetical protein
MASSKNQKYENAASKYDAATEQYTGQKGYENSLAAAKNGSGLADTQIKKGNAQGLNTTSQANAVGMTQGLQYNKAANQAAREQAGQQAAAAAAGAQSQATTAARAAGMNKAQAAMMGAQQNANAYQNAYDNAYSQQLNNANSNMESARNLNANQMNNATNTYGQNMAQRQNSMTAANNAGLSAAGTKMGAAQTEGQNEYERTWGNWGNALGIGGSVLKAFSDEDLKHYRECSKKVTIRSPKSIQKLKFVQKEN